MTIPYSQCKAPHLEGLLPEYFADLLDDPVCEEIERHLDDCSHCKGRYLTLLRVVRAAGVERANMMAVNSQDGIAVTEPAQPAQPAEPAAAAFATAGTGVKRKGKASGGP